MEQQLIQGLLFQKKLVTIFVECLTSRKHSNRVSLKDLKLIIIDEISMIGNITLLYIHQRFEEIFGVSSTDLFASISIIAVGDLYQLPPIKKKAFLMITKWKLSIFVIHGCLQNY